MSFVRAGGYGQSEQYGQLVLTVSLRRRVVRRGTGEECAPGRYIAISARALSRPTAQTVGWQVTSGTKHADSLSHGLLVR